MWGRGILYGALAAALLTAVYTLGARCTPNPLGVETAAFATAARRRELAAPLQPDDGSAYDAFAVSVASAPLHHISLCTRPSPKFEMLQTTARWHGDTVIPLGMGDPRFQQWGVGFGVKLEHVQAFLRSLPPGDLVLFTDAFDVLLIGGSEQLRAAFLTAVRTAMGREGDAAVAGASRGSTGSSGRARVPTVVFGTEQFSWPDAERRFEYPASDRAFQWTAYLNSGEGVVIHIGPPAVESDVSCWQTGMFSSILNPFA